MVKRLVMCVSRVRGHRGWSCVWGRVRGLDGQEVGHVCGTYPGLEV